MIHRLLDRLERPITFVVGKGGVGKTSTAAGIALSLADAGEEVRLISTDPAHSLTDLFGAPADGPSPCTPRLRLEELAAASHARTRLDPLEPALRELIDRGTYLDEDDATSLLEGSLPGLDEIGAALRLRELAAAGGRVVVDTAPTGHTLRMLEAPAVVDGWIAVFRAMADKADTVASALVGGSVRFSGEAALDELATDARAFADAARSADFVVVTGPDRVVRAESDRLVRTLRDRELRVVATVAVERPGAEADVLLPFFPGLRGCDALRAWLGGASSVPPGDRPPRERAAAPASGQRRTRTGASGAEPLAALLDRELVVFAGKGGVGKTTCAAAAAVAFGAGAPVVLAGADPAGSLGDVLPDPPAHVEVRDLDADRELERFRALYHDQVERAFRAVGLDRAARLDREVVESLWGLAPPGLDEVVAVAKLAGEEATGQADPGASPPDRTVLDTAPTGHFLRLVAMPELTYDWTRRLMRLLIKYRALGGLDAPAEPLVRFARRLRALQERLSDPSRTAIVIVTLDEPLVRAETQRLLGRLAERGLRPTAVLVNRAGPGADADFPIPTFRSPELAEPVGAAALRDLAGRWEPLP